MEPEESSTLWDTPFLVNASAKKRKKGQISTFTEIRQWLNISLCGYLHNSFTKGMNSWFWLRGRTEHLYGATVAGKLKYCNKKKRNYNSFHIALYTYRSQNYFSENCHDIRLCVWCFLHYLSVWTVFWLHLWHTAKKQKHISFTQIL